MEPRQIESAADFVEVLAATGRPTEDGIRVATEREIAALTNLSRPRVREYLAGLQTVGLLSRVQGSGTVLRVPDADEKSNVFTLMEKSGQLPIDDIERFREMLEIGVLPQLSTPLEEGIAAQLRALIDDMHAASANGDAAAGCEADLAFHRLLLRQADNALLTFVIDSLDGALRSDILDRRRHALAAETAANGGSKPEVFRTDSVHEEIVTALESGHPTAISAAIRLHFDVHRGLLA
ncbi:FadR/GntR family transcriptional regulator [Brevibacterium yomogidense]|uniref:FadR/GntR family transcriptional regulator n=1 Tax=Brevibacterium yomogidense TaxID=946573 RepID=UPI0018DF32BF|nr:FCD domain-containing protein [Brevibacterium yomogidense]